MEVIPATKADGVFHQIRQDILAGRLTPGARLRLAPLRDLYGVSTTVVREALVKLAEQRLVEVEPQAGFRVVTLSLTDLRDLTVARCEIECSALRLSIDEGDLEWEAQLVAAHHAMERTPRTLPKDPAMFTPQWTDAHARFHLGLLGGGPSFRLTATAMAMRASAELYRSWSRHAPKGDRDVPNEHGEILRATLHRDADTATGLLRQHIQRTADDLAQWAATSYQDR